jgi:protease-4
VQQPEPRRSKKAIAAFILGLSGPFLWVFGAVPAIIVALRAKRDLRRDGLLRGRALANTALILGTLDIILAPALLWVALVHGPLAHTERVAHFHLAGTLTDSPHADAVGAVMGQPSTFHELFKRLKEAKEDAAVKAAVLTLDEVTLQLPETEELRAALLDFESSGKKVLAHCDDQLISLPTYLTLAAASRTSIAPSALLELKGLYREAMYPKDGLAKIGVASDVVHIGDYKAAGEMLARSEPSDAAKENINWIFDGQYQSCLDMLGESLHKTPGEVKALIDKSLISGDQALEQGLISAVEHQDDFVEYVKREYGAKIQIDNDYHREPMPELSKAHPFRSCWNVLRYFARLGRPGSGDGIGLIYLCGGIAGGYGSSSDEVHCGDMRAAFKEAMEDEAIKAVVLRVNSPGGLVTASEVIHHAAALLQKKKPLIISMGNVAASGGYYVSCGAGTIFADASTITGSIGVIGSKLVSADLWKKLGVNRFAYQRGANADIFCTQHPFTEQQRALLTEEFGADYGRFKGHIVEGRGARLTKQIDNIAGGRIYTGKQALDLGLVDKIGGLEAAIAFAAQSVSLEKYEVRVFPEPKDAVELLADLVIGNSKSPSDLKTASCTLSKQIGALAGVSAEMPALASLLETLDRPHAAAVVELLGRLRLLNQEGMAMIMPQVLVYQ